MRREGFELRLNHPGDAELEALDYVRERWGLGAQLLQWQVDEPTLTGVEGWRVVGQALVPEGDDDAS